jgi:AbrB family looped-hinge helix DNA binding protein
MDTVFAQVNVKGQIVIPARLRDELKIKSGTKIAIHRDGGAIVLQPVTDEFLESLRGCLKGKGRPSATEVWEQVHRKESKGEIRRYGERR